MKPETVYCKNLCGPRIYHAAPLLRELSRQGFALLVEESGFKTHEDFWRLFKGTGPGKYPPEEEQVQMWFVDEWPRSVSKNTLIVPVDIQEPCPESRKDIAPLLPGQIVPTADEVRDRILRMSAKDGPLTGKKVLINAGPTVEDLDPVRFFSNRSTGKMGLALARAAYVMGADVTLVAGPTSLFFPTYLNLIRVRSAAGMFSAVREQFPNCDMFIAAAAVADFTPENVRQHKIKKTEGKMFLEMRRTTDILKYAGEQKKANQTLIGFSVETTELTRNSRQKLYRKNLDMIVANNPLSEGAGFAGDTNRVTLISREGERKLGKLSKLKTAGIILQEAAKL
ncbi:MAG TPA: bifunctional phosphopantothenoylcysteine decarboxylase/phosphopantothenate--cysteine ligase CoaBC [Caldithrix abyssi]|uniref:Bifunctional phosphopantothenoylcysteine decarboxylase/phosphopantothenate--cysteine ligase CoaBC n=1 Tax=Caldithrix abyssi TaxID=187145 RepID=A0A7V5VFA2_CALAY|nr:bifunctional phosphopantothenoylcysteine decarboxylase/phosphopantothenate--cysteine ligase CoaBC [Caldithrix abyssi]